MRKLIEHASLYEYENNGKMPPPSAGGQTPGFGFSLSRGDFDHDDPPINPSQESGNDHIHSTYTFSDFVFISSNVYKLQLCREKG